MKTQISSVASNHRLSLRRGEPKRLESCFEYVEGRRTRGFTSSVYLNFRLPQPDDDNRSLTSWKKLYAGHPGVNLRRWAISSGSLLVLTLRSGLREVARPLAHK